MENMRKRNLFFALFAIVCSASMAHADFSCGAGYVLNDTRKKIDGIPVSECQKLWCRDLEEKNTQMGNGNKPNGGYEATSAPVMMEDASGNTIECWGQRKWCSGEVRGQWNPEYGMYTRGGTDDITYQSYKKGSCFAWRLAKPNCPDGEVAILKDDKWICTVEVDTAETNRAATIRRTGTLRRVK